MVRQGVASVTRCCRRTTRQAATAAARPAQPGAVHVDGCMCETRHHKHRKPRKHTSEPGTAGFGSRSDGRTRAPHLAPGRAGPAGEHVCPQVADQRSAPAGQPARGQRLGQALCPEREQPAHPSPGVSRAIGSQGPGACRPPGHPAPAPAFRRKLHAQSPIAPRCCCGALSAQHSAAPRARKPHESRLRHVVLWGLARRAGGTRSRAAPRRRRGGAPWRRHGALP